MAERAPEGPKAKYTAEEASETYVPRPPSKSELNDVSKAQGLITDEWTGEPPAKDRPAGTAPGTAKPED